MKSLRRRMGRPVEAARPINSILPPNQSVSVELKSAAAPAAAYCKQASFVNIHAFADQAPGRGGALVFGNNGNAHQ